MTDLPETSDMIPMHENNSNQKNEIENPPPDVSARRVRVGALASLCRRDSAVTNGQTEREPASGTA
jgi:hypothetical protein